MLFTRDTVYNYYRFYYNRYPTNYEMNFMYTILDAMSKVKDTINKNGYCLDRAIALRKTLKSGKVYTFDLQGVKANAIKVNSCPHIVIPYTEGYYKGRTDWLYHSVYVNDNIVYSYEMIMPTPFDTYYDLLNRGTYESIKEGVHWGITKGDTDAKQQLIDYLIEDLTVDGYFKVPYCIEM